MSNKSIFIFRRDLRTKDNTALNHAIKESSIIYPIFIFTPEQVDPRNPYRSDNCVQFMVESLKELDADLGGVLTLLYGDHIRVIEDILYRMPDITSIYTNTDYTKYAIARDEELVRAFDGIVHITLGHDVCLLPPGTVLTGDGGRYQKFTPFYNKMMKKQYRSQIKTPYSASLSRGGPSLKIVRTKYKIGWRDAQALYKHNEYIHVNGGRDGALKILRNIRDWSSYNKTRNMLTVGTTSLSAYIKFGCISIREVYAAFIDAFPGGKNDLIKQLVWRDFYYQLPTVFGQALKPKYDNLKWDNNKALFKAWCEGRTGFPIVDAAMTQMNVTGYMHNRGRLITSNFLIKILLIDWQWGERYFAQKLVDYDPLVNNGNWQWSSSTGADSQPYFRIFNPWGQGKKHDDDAIYIKDWLPVLEPVEASDIHKWYKKKVRDKYKKEYPAPIVDYDKQRDRALTMYKKVV